MKENLSEFDGHCTICRQSSINAFYVWIFLQEVFFILIHTQYVLIENDIKLFNSPTLTLNITLLKNVIEVFSLISYRFIDQKVSFIICEQTTS